LPTQVYGCAQVAVTVGLQLAYTTVAGWAFVWVFMCTGSILAAAACHALCNVMGFPPFAAMGRTSLAVTAAGVALAVRLAPLLVGGQQAATSPYHHAAPPVALL
jgi:membrane protease YdiL (CAAX protease family)